MSYYENATVEDEDVGTAANKFESGSESPEAGALGRRSGRRPGLSGTREDILRAARKLFAEYGYQGTTMRAIAAESGVDAALIHHFYLSKEGIFAAAVEDAFDPGMLVGEVLEVGDVHQRGERLVRVFLRTWASPQSREPLTAVVRSAMSHPDAARLLTDLVPRQVVAKIVRATSPNLHGLRTALIGSQVIGLVMLRFVLKLEPIASAGDELIVSGLSPTIQRYLTGDITSAPGVGADMPGFTVPDG